MNTSEIKIEDGQPMNEDETIEEIYSEDPDLRGLEIENLNDEEKIVIMRKHGFELIEEAMVQELPADNESEDDLEFFFGTPEKSWKYQLKKTKDELENKEFQTRSHGYASHTTYIDVGEKENVHIIQEAHEKKGECTGQIDRIAFGLGATTVGSKIGDDIQLFSRRYLTW